MTTLQIPCKCRVVDIRAERTDNVDAHCIPTVGMNIKHRLPPTWSSNCSRHTLHLVADWHDTKATCTSLLIAALALTGRHNGKTALLLVGSFRL